MGGLLTLGRMTFYPATIVAVDANAATVRFDQNGHTIVLPHNAHNQVPQELREVGRRGFVSFPKAPPVFTEQQKN